MPCTSTALIIGGGIAGLSSAIALSRVGVACEVVEKNDPKEGASIGLSGQATNALVELGLYELVYKAGHPFPHDSGAAAMRNSAGRVLSPGPGRPSPNQKLGVGIYRPALIDLMTKVATELGVKIFPGTTFIEIDNRLDGVMVSLTNGEQRTYDILVGADGIGSTTRDVLFPGCPQPTYTGQWSIRWMAPGPPVEPESWYKSPVGRLGFYSLPEGPEGIVYVPSVFNVPENKRMGDDDIYEMYSALLDSMTAPAIVELRSRLNSESTLIGRPFRWILLPDPWYSNRSLLIGDAAHATTSHMGMGGGMAIEDSVVLAQRIRDAKTVDDAFKVFMTRRFERVSIVVNTSLELSRLEQQHASPVENMALLGKARATISVPY
jgi:2-polyprenyl-6-methoxyphenol hydroxylase-like FAD-dependent oxidoreductase